MADRDVTVRVNLQGGGNLDSYLKNLRKQIQDTQKGLSSGTLAPKLRESVALQRQMADLQRQAEEAAGLRGDGHAGRPLFGRGSIAHRVARFGGSMIDRLGGQGAGMAAQAATYGPAGLALAGLAVATMVVNEKFKQLQESLDRATRSIAEAAENISQAQSSIRNVGAGGLMSAQQLRRDFAGDNLFQSPHAGHFLATYQRLRNNPQQLDAFLAHEEQVRTQVFRRGQRRPLAVHQEDVVNQLLASNNLQGGDAAIARARGGVLQRAGINPDEFFRVVRNSTIGFWMGQGHSMNEGLGGHMTPAQAVGVADVMGENQLRAMSRIGDIRRLRHLGAGGPNLEPGAGNEFGTIQPGQRGEIASLHGAIQEAAARGQQEMWQNELLGILRGWNGAGGINIAPAAQGPVIA